MKTITLDIQCALCAFAILFAIGSVILIKVTAPKYENNNPVNTLNQNTMPQTIYYHVAISTVLIIAIAFMLKARPFGRRKPTIEDLWTAGCYYTYLRALINSSNNMNDLQIAWEIIENTWFKKVFREPIHRFRRKRYYVKLIKEYAKMETKLTKIPVTLCTN